MQQVLYICTWIVHIYILEVNLFAFAYRLFHEDFSPIYGAFHCLYIVMDCIDRDCLSLWEGLLFIAGQHEYAAVCVPTHYKRAPDESGCTMYIHCGPDPTNVTISTFDSTQSVSLQPDEVHKMSFDEALFPIDGVESKAIRVESNFQIQILVYKESYASSIYRFVDVYEVPSSNVNGTRFVTSGYKDITCANTNFLNQFIIVSTLYDDTTLTIQYQNDLPVEIVLSSHGSYTKISDHPSNPIASGTMIIADAPVTVVSGNLCETNPHGGGSYISNIPPIANLTDHYVIPHLISQNTENPGYSLHVVASDDNTVVEFDGSVAQLDSVGNSVTFELANRREWMSLNCSKNCLAVQYTKSTSSYGMFMLSMLGANQFYTSTTFTTLDLHPTSYISIVVEGEAPGTDILLNGDSLGDLDWGTIDGYATAETAIDNGTYVMESLASRPFVVFVYFHDDGNSGPGGAGYTKLPANRSVPSTPSPTTTPPPADGNYTLPQLSVRLNGTVHTEDGENMTPQCAQVLILWHFFRKMIQLKKTCFYKCF